MKTAKKTLALLMALLTCFAVFGGALADSIPTRDVYSGTCGDSLAWELDTETGVLNITGIGAMYNYSESGNAPWYGYRNFIKSVIIADGVTSIGNWAFGRWAYNNFNGAYLYRYLTSITIPSSVMSIGESAFRNYEDREYYYLRYVYISDLAAFNAISFSNNFSNPIYVAQRFYLNGELITDLVIPDGITEINPIAFRECSALNSVTFPDSVISIGESAFSSCILNYALFLGAPPAIGSGVFSGESSGFRIYYMAEHADEWSPNGEAAWNGYPIFPAYTVTFVDSMDGSVIDEQIVFTGKAAEAPVAPRHDGYAFTGWDCAFDNVTQNLTVTALYEVAYTTGFTGDALEFTDPQVGDTFYWMLSVDEGSGLGSGRWLIDYDENYFKPTAYSLTWSGGITAQITEAWDNDEAYSDIPQFACNVNYEGNTGTYPAGEAGNMYCNLGMYITTYEYMGVQMGGPMVRLNMKWLAVPEESVTLPVPVTVVEAKRVVESIDGAYTYADYDEIFMTEGALVVSITPPEPELPVLIGDVDCDGTVSFTDVAALYQYIIGASEEPKQLANCDINGDGTINFSDIAALYSGLIG